MLAASDARLGPAPATSRLALWPLRVGSAVGLVVSCGVIAHIPNLVDTSRQFLLWYALAFLCYAGGAWLLRGAAGRAALVFVLLVAAACRLVLLPAPPTLSTDAYRYVWDARLTSAGIDPYRHPPVAPELAPLRDAAIFPHLNHPTWRTIYPPAAQAFFAGVYTLAPDNVFAMKVALGLAEALALVLLLVVCGVLDVPWGRVAVYAWNPLVVVEVWSSAHLDALVLVAIVGATLAAVRGRRGWAAFFVGLGTLVKIYPAALLPLLLGAGALRALAVFGATVGVGYLPFVLLRVDALGSLRRYLAEEQFNPGLVRSVVDSGALTLVALAAWVVWAATRRGSLVERAVPLVGGTVLLAPSVFPWYAVWLVPFLALRPSARWIGFTGTIAAAYAFFLSTPWAIPTWARALEVLPLVGGAAWWAMRRVVAVDGRKSHNVLTSAVPSVLGWGARRRAGRAKEEW